MWQGVAELNRRAAPVGGKEVHGTVLLSDLFYIAEARYGLAWITTASIG